MVVKSGLTLCLHIFNTPLVGLLVKGFLVGFTTEPCLFKTIGPVHTIPTVTRPDPESIWGCRGFVSWLHWNDIKAEHEQPSAYMCMYVHNTDTNINTHTHTHTQITPKICDWCMLIMKGGHGPTNISCTCRGVTIILSHGQYVCMYGDQGLSLSLRTSIIVFIVMNKGD